METKMKPRTAASFVPHLAAFLAAFFMSAQARPAARPAATRAVACFLADGFPTVDAPAVPAATMEEALRGFSAVRFSDAGSLSRGLDDGRFKVLLLANGSAFPAEAWPAISAFLGRGGSLVYLGGDPFTQPVRRAGGDWLPEERRTSMAHELLIAPSDAVKVGLIPFYSGAKAVAADEDWFAPGSFPLPSTVFEPTVRFTTGKYFRDEDGGTGPRLAVMRPMVRLTNAAGLPFACPLFVIDRTGGEAAGGRWVIAPSDAPLPTAVIRRSLELALEGASDLKVLPIHASVHEGETPVIRISRFAPGDDGAAAPASGSFTVEVRNKAGRRVFKATVPASGTAAYSTAEAVIRTASPLTPGLYTVEATVSAASRRPDRATAGFWVADPGLLASGPRLTAGRDWLLRDGRTFPVIGTTYMASDVDREFLFEPNPAVWNRDFAEMRRAGVNMVRTGIWTGWPRMAVAPGAFDVGVLRAAEAFVETAARNGILVCFNFFAFSPPENGGTNPYLDPRSLRWQKDFVTAVVSHFRDCGWLSYDLINEPSYTPPDDLWKTSPIRDAYEQAAWREWLLKKHPGGAAEIAACWRAAAADDGLFAPPSKADMAYAMIRDERQPRKALDFHLFAQDVAAGWASGLTREIKAAGGGLVTLGQDEGGAADRPKQQFFYPALDFTSIHDWWFNDDLLWDVISTKVPELPSLVSETGLMRLERIDGRAWRTPEKARDLLDRKFAYAFMGRGAGVLEWAWNINPYMPIDNESVIGFKRPDGTFKPEYEVLGTYAAFFAAAAPRLADFEPDPVVLVSPDAKLFSGQPQAQEGTQRLVRVLAEDFGVVPTMLSEFKLTTERLAGARLIIVPSPQWLADAASKALAEAAGKGARILFTGTVEGNEYGLASPPFAALGLTAASLPVEHYEQSQWAGGGAAGPGFATFGALKSENLLKSADGPASFAGSIIHEPLPLEYAEERAPLDALLEAALKSAGLEARRRTAPVASRVLLSPGTALAVAVNESSADLSVDVAVDSRAYRVPVKAGRSRLVLIDRRSGEVILSGGESSASDIKRI